MVRGSVDGNLNRVQVYQCSPGITDQNFESLQGPCRELGPSLLVESPSSIRCDAGVLVFWCSGVLVQN